MGKVISECKDDDPWKNLIGKVSATPFLLRRHSDLPPSGVGI